MRYIILVLITILATTGWILNIYKLSQCDFQYPYQAEVIHSVGIIPFVGAFTGYMNLGK